MYKNLEKHIDMALCRQMADLIYRLSKEKEKEHIYNQLRHHFLFQDGGKTGATMEEAYELRYPGEVLERLKERTGFTVEKIRALAIALALTKQLHDERMFVGTQYTSFLKMAEKLAGSEDVFLSGALYLLEGRKKDLLFEQIKEYPYGNVEEIIYILSVFPDNEQIWELLKTKLNLFLGTGRTFDAYENSGLYIWMAGNLGHRMKGYRKKDMDIIKYITRLPFVYASQKNPVGIKMCEAGYTEAEVIFLNLEAARRVMLPEALCWKTITMEKMAVNACRYFLGGDTQHPESIYRLCGELFRTFKDFDIKINGDAGIAGSLYGILKVGNVRSYQFLYQYKGWREANPEWLHIDLTDPKWFPLYQWLKKDEFDRLVDATLSGRQYKDSELKLYLGNYRTLTGKEYGDTFWTKHTYGKEDIFLKLAGLGYMKPEALIKDYIKAYKGSPEELGRWKHMAGYLKDYIKRWQSVEAYQMLKMVDEEIGVECLDRFFSARDFLFDCFHIQTWGRYFEGLDFMRVYLDQEENYQVFEWIEQQVFMSRPEEYINFLIHILRDSDNLLWFPKEEAQKVFHQLLNTGEISYGLRPLMKIYLTEEEQTELDQTEKRKAERTELFKRFQEERERKKEFNKVVSANRDSGHLFQHIEKYLDGYYWEKKNPCKIVAAYILDQNKRGQLFLTGKEAYHLMEVLGIIYKEKEMHLADVTHVLGNVVEVEPNG